MKSCTESDFRTTHPTPWALCRCRADSRAQPEHPGGPREDCELGTASEHLGFPPEDCEPSTASEHPGVPPEDCEPGTASEHLGSPQECGRLLSCIACPTGHISAARSMPSGGFPTCRRKRIQHLSHWPACANTDARESPSDRHPQQRLSRKPTEAVQGCSRNHPPKERFPRFPLLILKAQPIGYKSL